MMSYYSKKTLQGFDSYKYRAVDTSPLSVYVMHPYWDWVVQFYPTWLAPNTLTFVGFVLVTLNFLITCYFDWYFYASSPNRPEYASIPQWIWFFMFLFHFGSHTLDGTDGKQAKRTGSSSPLGELFDHGVDSLSTVFMPVAIFSTFGRGHDHGGTALDMHILTWCIFFTFALAHWEKYNTQELYLPWGYDIALLAIALVYILNFVVGVQIWRFDVADGYSASKVMIVLVVVATFGLSFPVSLNNIYQKSKPPNMLKYGLIDGLTPLLSYMLLAFFSTSWLFFSPNNIAEVEPRLFLWHQGVLFSSHCCRLIIAQMTSTKVGAINWLMYPYMLLVSSINLILPSNLITLDCELKCLQVLTVFVTIAHAHFGCCVVKQIAHQLGVSVFSIKPSRSKSK